jgi:predicted DNA-binding transcriptional regulator AlpA
MSIELSGRKPPRLLPKAEVCQRVGLTFPTIWKMIQKREFPRPCRNGTKTMWIETEIDDYVLSRPRCFYKGETESENQK